VSGFTHLAGAVLSTLGLCWLVIATWGDPVKTIIMLIYGVCLLMIYVTSATFHLTRAPDNVLLWLRRFDHAAIYTGIAGTYTPFAYVALTGATRWLLLGLVWGLALVGVVYKLFFLKGGNSRWSLAFYLAMGWVGLLALPQGLAALPFGAVILLVAGGLVYSIGAVIFGLQRPNLHPCFGHHELWHLFVLGGSALHFAAVARYIVSYSL
jgi:hemolysin III